ncbi:MAG: hypothetical protein ABIR25_05685 [Sphingomicrobium sp.]
MSKHDRGQWDWLVEIAGASAPAVAAAYAVAKLDPVNGWPLATGVLVVGGVFLAALTAIRIVPAEARHLALPEFETAVVLDDVLLLDEPYRPIDELLLDQPLVEAAIEALAELLLDDPLPAAARDSRVVQLFADGRMPTAGQLKHSIDRHLADGARPVAPSDASDTLSEALTELRRSLRQA